MAPSGTVLVTGANGGLGTAIVARILSSPDIASENFGLYTARKSSTATSLQGALQSAPQSHKHEMIDLDLSSIESVRNGAAQINRRVVNGELPPIRSLILNAGYQEQTTIVRGGFIPYAN